MQKYLYAAETNAFYPLVKQPDYEAVGMWPEKGIEVDEDLFVLFQSPPLGKIRVSGADGMPAWADIPPLTEIELVSMAEAKKTAQRAIADYEIAWRQDAVDTGIASDKESFELAQWKKYRVLLMRVDTAHPEWPTPPEA